MTLSKLNREYAKATNLKPESISSLSTWEVIVKINLFNEKKETYIHDQVVFFIKMKLDKFVTISRKHFHLRVLFSKRYANDKKNHWSDVEYVLASPVQISKRNKEV